MIYFVILQKVRWLIVTKKKIIEATLYLVDSRILEGRLIQINAWKLKSYLIRTDAGVAR